MATEQDLGARGRLLAHLRTRVDIASLVAFRVLFGAVMLVSVVRFWLRGWIDELYIEPAYHFTYWGFEWVRAWPAWGMYLHFAALGVLALFIALGLFYRVSVALFFLGFTYLELIDKTTYLNHYYLISILAFLMIFLPLHRGWSLDAVRRPALRAAWAPRWCLWTIRAQVGLVYFFAGVAKLKGDWLWHAKPLSIWLAANTDLPVLGPYLTEPWVAYFASWFGAVFDLTIVGWLLWPRTRPYAFAVVVAFHVITARLFYLGAFPWIMIGNALIFFSPSWPRRWLPGLAPAHGPTPDALRARPLTWAGKLGFGLLGAHFLIQVLMPLRHHLYPGDVCWTEEGFRYAWHVMLVEKAGRVIFHVTEPGTDADTGPGTDRTWLVYPNEYLTSNQEKQMSIQPDMILQMAHHIARDFAARGHPGVAVRAEAYVSWNGRRSRLLIDPRVDLAAERDRLVPQTFILRHAGRAHIASRPGDDHQLHPAILSLLGPAALIDHGLAHPVAHDLEALAVDLILDRQIQEHLPGPELAHLVVGALAAFGVGMPIDAQPHVRIIREHLRDLIEYALVHLIQIPLALLEPDTWREREPILGDLHPLVLRHAAIFPGERLVRASIIHVENPIPIIVRVRAAILVFEAIPVLCLVQAAIHLIEDPVAIVIRLGAAILVFESISVLCNCPAFIYAINNAIIVGIRDRIAEP